MGISSRITRWSALAAATLVVGLLGSPPAHATTLVRLSTEQLVDASELIVHGTVVEVWAELDQVGAVWTRAQIEVTDVLKGDPETLTVIVDQRGGTYAGRTYQTGGAARFSVGEEALLFLETVESGHTVPVGMVQGKYTVQIDPHLRAPVVHRVSMPFGVDYDARFLPLPKADARVTLADLEETIQDRVSAGWDGEPIPGASSERLARINAARLGVK